MRACYRCVAIVLLAMTVSAQHVFADPCQEGRRLFLENNYLAAEPLLRRCLEQGEQLMALLPLTMMTVIQQRVSEGLEFGQRALKLAPDNANARYWYGRALLLAGDENEARAQWEQGVALDAGHAGILEGLARLSLQKGELARAYNLFNQMALQGIKDIWLHRMLGELAQRQGYWSQAVKHWLDVTDGDDSTEEDLLILGELLILAGRSDEAADHFRAAIAAQPTAAAYGGLGEALFALDHLDSASVVLEKAAALDPDQPRYVFNLANALQLLERHEEAGRHFRTYLEHRPDDPVGRFHYGVHLIHRGRAEDAVEQLEHAVKKDASYVQARVVLAHLYQDLGKADAALALVDELAVLDPEARYELDAWRDELQGDLAGAASALAQGKVRLLHLVAQDTEAADFVSRKLSEGMDFGELAIRHSLGPTAARGGDIGWIDPTDMAAALRRVIEDMKPGTTSPPLEWGGQYHFFKRIR